MTRVTNGLQRQRRHKKFIKLAKWFRLGRSKVYKQVRLALVKQWQHAYKSRKEKKRDFRRLRIERLSAAVKEHGGKYSTFMGSMTKKNILVDRKVLSNVALAFPQVFAKFYAEIVK